MNTTHTGWHAAEDLFDEDRHEIEALRCQITIPEVADALGRQIHATGLTCPSPEHHQSGRDAPAWTFYGSDGVERWKCGGCDIGGDLFAFVQVAESCAFPDAVEVVATILVAAPRLVTAIPRYPSRHPEDPDRLRPVRSAEGIEECAQYCLVRGWGRWEEGRLSLDPLARDRWSFVFGDDGYWLRLYSDDTRQWWQERALDGQLDRDGQPYRWRSPYGRPSQLFTWEPLYIERRKVAQTDYKRMTRRTVTAEVDHTPAVAPLVLGVEGASDFLTAVVAQGDLDIGQRFTVVGLPGAGRTDLLADRDDWAVITDNDEAGERARVRIDAEQRVRHLYVAEQYEDLSQWWQDIATAGGKPPPWVRRRQWINQLREALTSPHQSEEER
jgi:hypothetical protein